LCFDGCATGPYIGRSVDEESAVLRPVMSLLGSLFSLITLVVVIIGLSIGAVLHIYGKDLPSHESLANYTPPTISRIYSAEGRIIDEFARERRLFTPAGDIPDLVKQAFISAEDKNFYSHHGYDAMGIASAIYDAVKSRGKNVRGASTITQQVMKNFLLSGDRQMERKIKEIILATRIEETLSKEQILELYLNEIFLGQNSYGVTAAAQTYFNKSLRALAPHEAATIAAMPKAPSDYHPVRERERLLDRRNFVLREMWENGYLTEAAYRAEREMPLRSVQNGDFTPFSAELPPRDYFTDEIRRQLSEIYGEGEFFTGGLTVRATIDPEMQVHAARALRRQLEAYDRGQGRWRGTGESLPEEVLGAEADWQAALAALRVPRDIELDGLWFPAVVLETGDQAMRIGIEGIDGVQEVPRSDIRWLPGDFRATFARGDVVHVRAVTKDGAFENWSLRQVPEVQGAFMAMDVNTGRVISMQGGFSYQHSVFNRATQAMRQPVAAAQFVEQVLRAHAAAHRDRAIAQPHDHPPCAGGGDGSCRALCRTLWRLSEHGAVSGQFAGVRGNHAVQHGGGLCDVRQWRRARAPQPCRPGAGPIRAHRLPAGHARLRRLPRSGDRARPWPPDRLGSRAGDERDHRLSAHLDDDRCGGTRHGEWGHQPAGARGRQDRHHQRCARRVVHWLHQQYRGGLLYRP
jgi:penicillin-binding protein 1A